MNILLFLGLLPSRYVSTARILARRGNQLTCSVFLLYQPASYATWERTRAFLRDKLKRMGVLDCAFPLHRQENMTPGDGTRDSDGISELRKGNQLSAASLVYPCYARWITSHRDLPLRLNQWTMAFSQEPFPQPLFQCREFLRQEAHTAHLTQHDASEEIRQVLDVYAAMYKDLLAVPVVTGYKATNYRERVSDASETRTAVVVGYIPTLGQCIYGGICRELGQRFSKEYGIAVPDPATANTENDTKSLLYVWQNTWSLSIRVIGLMIATHSDNHGLVLPPRVAETQVVIIPLQYARSKQDHQEVHARIESIRASLSSRGVRATTDLRDWRSGSWKLQESVIRGVPLRLCLGSDGLAGEYVTTYRRDLPLPERETRINFSDLPDRVIEILESIQGHLFQKASDTFDSHQERVTDWDGFIHVLCCETTKTICLAPHCLGKNCEQRIKGLRTSISAMNLVLTIILRSKPTISH